MKRRHLLLAAFAAPFAAWGQQAGREYRIVVGFVQGDELTRRLTGVIRQRLASHGFVEGKNLRIELTTDACCGEHYAREKARAMLALRPDAVLTFGTVLARADRVIE